MKKVSLVLSVLSAVALSSTASANSYNIQTSNGAGCSQNEDTGRSVEFGADMNTYTNEGTVSFTYNIQLGRDKLKKIDCSLMYDLEVSRQRMELERQRLELELLRAQIKNAKSKNLEITPSDDW
jgi:hypothetical protein